MPLCMGQLQKMIDTNRLRTDVPIDVSQLLATGLFTVKPQEKEGGFMLQDEVSVLFYLYTHSVFMIQSSEHFLTTE